MLAFGSQFSMKVGLVVVLSAFVTISSAYIYDPAWTQYNLNENEGATDPLDFWGEWTGHNYTKSPTNWRFPFYSLFLDRFVNGDPTNDNINGTSFEHDINSNQMRHGGDLQGLLDTLDYLEGMGIKGLYIAGSPFMNQPWGYDQYSPLDLSLLDQHFGTLELWRQAIDEIHSRGMYVILDNTFATLGDLIGFDGYLNVSAPFTMKEHKVQWKSDRTYHDFGWSNTYNDTCAYPKFWLDTGYPVGDDVTSQLGGCYAGEFDQYGDTEAFGVYPDWRRELSKFASVQDRLREWHEPTRLKLENFYCMMIAQLDIDGYRYDKAVQSTVDAMAYMNAAMRTCARRFGKENFFLPGEITGGNVFGSVFLGRGRQPDMRSLSLLGSVQLTNASNSQIYLREAPNSGLDAAAFHYTVYRTLTRFLGMDGNLAAGYDSPLNWVDQWNDFLLSNDLVNANTGVFDPRHMYGVTNQDVFRWPAIVNGTYRQLLGHFITTLLMPGIPLLLWGEEQAYYVLDNTATNYIFGRQPMSAQTAWKTHGCYSFVNPSTQYFNMPIDAARHGCEDETVTYDHRDPAHPFRNMLKHMYALREYFPVLNDGFFLQQLSNQTEQVQYPGSSGVATETGIWSVMRGQFPGYQDLSNSSGAGSQPVWMIFSNLNTTKNYQFDCSNNDTNMNITGLIAPFDAGAKIINLFYPYDEITLEASPRKLGLNGSTAFNGCVRNMTMDQYGFRAYVLAEWWTRPKPMITKFVPGHDARLLSNVTAGETESVNVQIEFSSEMDCDSVTDSISIISKNELGLTPTIDNTTIVCSLLDEFDDPPYTGMVPGAWLFQATVTGVPHGVHRITINRPITLRSPASTNATDHFLFRTGAFDNPIVFPTSANYSTTLLSKNGEGQLLVSHAAAGADLWRYSTNWQTTFSDWMNYTGGSQVIQPQAWSGTVKQQWPGDHVRIEYFSRLGGSSAHVQEADSNSTMRFRRFPHLFLNGPYNQYGYDAGLDNSMKLTADSTWEFHFMTEWRSAGTIAQINVWGMNPDGLPDQSYVLGDIDGDSILDRLPPSSLSAVVLNITQPPPKPHLAWKIVVDDATLKFTILPAGTMYQQLMVYILLLVIPLITAGAAVWAFMLSFYQVKFNEIGVRDETGYIPLIFKKGFRYSAPSAAASKTMIQETAVVEKPKRFSIFPQSFLKSTGVLAVANETRRTVLIATMEYDIEDWALKVKIGGLGVMAQLMGKNLGHQDLIWVVPCVGDIEYPVDTPSDPMVVTIMGKPYEVNVQYHKLRNITYVLLDAPVFRKQTKAEPYPPRMDDMPSAIYYSAWNQCIAQAITRFPIDLYHINDYHGSLAPLHLLPRTIPACLSLHNAEFQGLWPMRNKEESAEVCSVFNLSSKVVADYVQFGEVFNLLHAGASYLRVHQQGFGAVGVSKKYGKRAHARYPIFWGLRKIGKLPNPDPSDTGEWDKKLPKESDIRIDAVYEAERGDLRKQAQEWAGLEVNPDAELFVFVGRWSMQKGIDLIADIFPSILEAHPNVQLITVGPVIDLYGKFAAAKLDRMMALYPGRVCSKPVFTALPPFIFSGAEFALIPSRDEPFGLVAVEFGRKGALGVGARVGGLGQMPGWWFTVESTAASHLLHQFRVAIEEALVSKKGVRAMMRARSAKQRFPVAQWVEDLEILQGTAIRIHGKYDTSKRRPPKKLTKRQSRSRRGSMSANTSGANTPSQPASPVLSRRNSFVGGSYPSLAPRLQNISSQFMEHLNESVDALQRAVSQQGSMGSRHGPGHVMESGRTIVHQTDGLFIIPDERYTSDEESELENSDIEDVIFPDQVAMRGRRVTPREIVIPLSPTSPKFPRSPRPVEVSFDSAPTLDLETPSQVYADSPRVVDPTASLLSVDTVVGDRTDYFLQKVDPFFTDSAGIFYGQFQRKLEGLNGSNSETVVCIEDFLIKSEKKWFEAFRNAKLGRYGGSRESLSTYRSSRGPTREPSRAPTLREKRPLMPGRTLTYTAMLEAPPTPFSETGSGLMSPAEPSDRQSVPSARSVPSDSLEGDRKSVDEFLLGNDYKPPRGLVNWMQIRVGDWPIYAFFLAFGQIIAANSYQITLLTGEVGQSAAKLYVIASIYLATSIVWWVLFRSFASRLCLSLPFVFYGLAFVFIGIAHWGPSYTARTWMQNIGSALYAVASSSGSIYFSLNFGDEGGAQVRSWVFRACVIQGTQQAYVVALWYWGSVLTRRDTAGLLALNDTFANSWRIAAVTLPIAGFFWVVALLMWFGLPQYYRQHPGAVPDFYRSVLRRKIVLWFFVTVVIQNFFLSAPYGRNWAFLFGSQQAKTWQVACLTVGFFVFVWAGILWFFGWLSTSHTWILPLFAVGLGAPRWAQIWWGTSNIGLWLPWAGGATASALVSRCLWLWLGVLDALQGVGLGMILLGTLTRLHVCFTLVVAQVLGSVATMVARGFAPNRIGPGPISPDLSEGYDVLWQVWFWLGLGFNLLICVGFFMFYRKEQLTKP